MIHIPIEERYNKNRGMFHSGAFAIAAGVVGVGGAATTGIMGMSAANRAAKAQGKASKEAQKRTNKATKIFNQQQQQLRERVESIDPTIKIPEFNLASATTEAIEQANRITANTIEQLKKIDPYQQGAVQRAYATLEQGQNLASELLSQGAPEESRRAVLRKIAETGGAGFNIATAGKGMNVPSITQSNYARQLGLQDIDFRLQGAALAKDLGNTAMAWRGLSAGFLAPTEALMQFGLQGRGQNIDVAQANIRNRMAQAEMIGGLNLSQYQAATAQSNRLYELQQANIQASTARDLANQKAIGGMFQAASGAVSGVSNAYGQQQTARLYDARTQAMGGPSIFPT